MKTWKGKARAKSDVWPSEVRLREANTARRGKVQKLLKLLKEDFVENVL